MEKHRANSKSKQAVDEERRSKSYRCPVNRPKVTFDETTTTAAEEAPRKAESKDESEIFMKLPFHALRECVCLCMCFVCVYSIINKQ